MDFDFINKGINELMSKLQGWGESFIKMLPNILIAFIVIFVFWTISRFIRRSTQKAFTKSHFNQSLADLLATMTSLLVLSLGLILALGILDLQKTVFSLLAGVGVIGLALGFAFRDLAANFISGIMLAIRTPMQIDDVVEINDFMGTVLEIRIRDTKLRSFEGQDIIIPNKEFTSNAFINYSSNGKRKIIVKSGIGYEDDVKKGIEVFKEALKNVNGVLSDPEPAVHVEELGGSSVNLAGHIWIDYPGESYLQVKTEAYVEVKSKLESEGFNIPFPIRTLDVADSVLDKLGSSLSKGDSKIKDTSKQNNLSKTENTQVQ